MKRLFALALMGAALIAAAPSLSGCAALRSVTSTAARAELTATQALYVAEAAFEGASMSLERAVDSGALKGPAAAKARAAYDKAHAALLAARQAKAAGDQALVSAKAAEATTGSGQIEQLALTGGGFGQSTF